MIVDPNLRSNVYEFCDGIESDGLRYRCLGCSSRLHCCSTLELDVAPCRHAPRMSSTLCKSVIFGSLSLWFQAIGPEMKFTMGTNQCDVWEPPVATTIITSENTKRRRTFRLGMIVSGLSMQAIIVVSLKSRIPPIVNCEMSV